MFSDPIVAISRNDTAYYCYMRRAATRWELFLDWTGNGGLLWHGPVSVRPDTSGDRPNMAIGFVPWYPDSELVFIAYQQAAPTFTAIAFGRSTDGGRSFSFSPVGTSNNKPTHIGIGGDGQVYLAYPAGTGPLSVHFRASFNGGLGFVSEITINNGDPSVLYRGIKPQNIRVSPAPIVAVDTSRGEFDSTLYVVWAGVQYGSSQTQQSSSYVDYDPDIFISKSTTGGQQWSTARRVNNDPAGNNKDQWMPWVDVDIYGGVNVVFLDSRNDSVNDAFTEAYLARSVDGGETFTNFPVSTVRFKPCNAWGGATGAPDEDAYIGDYIGITSDSNFIYPCWPDNRTRRTGPAGPFQYYQVYVAPIPLRETLSGPIAENKTLVDNITLTGDLTVPAGKTLTILGSSRIKAIASSDDTHGGLDPNKVEIIVQGQLKIAGGGLRPDITTTSGVSGTWYGIRVLSGGSVDWGHGCVVRGADVGVTLADGALSTEIRNVRIENTSTTGFSLAENVRLVHDTVLGIGSGKGIEIANCDPVIDSCFIDSCSYGIYAVGASARLRGNVISGPGTYGAYIIIDPEFFTYDTVKLFDNDVTGYFSAAHLYAGLGAGCIVDSCDFIADSTGGPRSPYGVKATANVWVKMRRSRIKHYATTGFYSDNSVSDLGKSPDYGNNSIYTSGCTSPCTGSRVVHIFDFGFGPMGEGPLGPPPDLEALLFAEGNWWGASTPDPAWFDGSVDYTPWLAQPPAAKVAAEIATAPSVPDDFTLSQNYPNPFNAGTVISYDLPEAGRVNVSVFNVLGQTVRVLADRDVPAGQQTVVWDGRDENGRVVASGLYFYRLQANRFTATRKMMLVK